jgi:hypothetical protein
MRGPKALIAAITVAFLGAGSTAPAAPPSKLIRGLGSSLGQLALPSQPDAAGQSQVFYVSGSAGNLYPGSASGLNLSLQNPLKSPITVSSISILAGNANSGCPASLLVVVPQDGSAPWPLNKTYTFNVSIAVPAGTTVPVPSPVTLSLDMSATDACDGGSFPLFYGGNANG